LVGLLPLLGVVVAAILLLVVVVLTAVVVVASAEGAVSTPLSAVSL
jgi:hypothetical protein